MDRDKVHDHYGHRKRMKENIVKTGFTGFSKHNILEVLLFFSIPQGDTNPVAHRLLERFGSFSGVFDAAYEDLLQVEGVGPQSATLIKAVQGIMRVYAEDKHSVAKVMTTSSEWGNYLVPKFYGVTREVVYGLFFDSKFKLLNCQLLCEGGINGASFSSRTIAESAFRVKATNVVVAHNHPFGLALPSDRDVATTEELYRTLKKLEIRLVDHVIVAGDDFVSLADSGLLHQINET